MGRGKHNSGNKSGGKAKAMKYLIKADPKGQRKRPAQRYHRSDHGADRRSARRRIGVA